MILFSRFPILKFVYKQFILFFLVGSFFSLVEISLLLNLKPIEEFLLSLTSNNYFSKVLLLLFYLSVIMLNLFIIYKSKYKAFEIALNLCLFVSNKNKHSYIANEDILSSLMTIERERLAREILAPLFNICTKILFPVVSIFLFTSINNISPLYIFILFTIMGIVFYLSSRWFSKLALNLESVLRNLIEKITIYTKTFSNTSRFEYPVNKYLINENYKLSSIEGFIDVVSQLPRQIIDVLVFGIIVFSLLNNNNNILFSLIVTSPLLLRSVSYLQAIYKSYASIKSNYSALNVTNSLSKNVSFSNPLPTEVCIDLMYNQDKRILSDIKSGTEFQSCSFVFDSGYGKTNCILNFLHSVDFLPTRIRLDIRNIAKEEVGYVSSDPYFSYINRNHLKFNYPLSLIPDNNKNVSCSSGELFRNSFIQEMERGIKLLIIDESIVSIPSNQRNDLINFCKDSDIQIPIIIITHSKDIVNICDFIFK